MKQRIQSADLCKQSLVQNCQIARSDLVYLTLELGNQLVNVNEVRVARESAPSKRLNGLSGLNIRPPPSPLRWLAQPT